ncbi:cold shock domain-containing protein [Candidatus Woesearchaeota archaeon]|nr:cold shock domain-containing protein [Candidatus Woesearchaeota archaeon]
MEGKVKWFNRVKGYGFVEGDDGAEYFVHHTAVPRGTFLRENDRVSFNPAETERGKQARDVVLLQKGSEIVGKGAPAEEQAEPEAEPEDSEDFGEEEDLE